MKAQESTLKHDLIKGLDGDDVAYRSFLENLTVVLRPFIQKNVSRYRQSQLDIEDVVQDVLIAVHRKAHTYDRETPVTAWVFAIARYKLVDTMRRSTKHDFHVHIDDAQLDLESSLQNAEQRMILTSALASLPTKLKKALELVKVQGLSIREAALEVGATESAVKVNVHRATRALRRLLAP